MDIILNSPAKVNLTLSVTGRRADGYHTLQSIFAFTQYGDRLHFSPADEIDPAGDIDPADDIELIISGPEAEALRALDGDGANNLIYKAAKALQHYLAEKDRNSKPLRAKIWLEKNIPIASGVGGGSMNAATALLGLQQLWGHNVPRDDLHAMALSLGADVPACLYRQPLWVEGIGEHLQNTLLDRAYHIVLINPRRHISTPSIFKQLKKNSTPFTEQQTGQPVWALDELRAGQNDLQRVATAIEPSIQTVLQLLSRQDGCLLSRMSGSGATCFGLFDTKQRAAAAATVIQHQQPNWWVHLDVLSNDPIADDSV